MNMNLTMAMEGFYSLKVHGGKRGEIDFGTHKNLILDAGINYILRNSGSHFERMVYFHIGSGSSRPAVGQVQLDARYAYTNRKSYATHGYVSKEDSENGNAYGYTRFNVQFDKGAAKGNISEIGVGFNSDGNPLWSRSLILDKGGNPTSITILEDEYLTVTYEVRRYVSTEVVTTILEYDDDGEKKQVECKVIPSTNTREDGWGSAGLRTTLDINSKGHYLDRPRSNSKPKKVAKGASLTMEYKYDITYGNDVDISGPVTSSGSGPLVPEGTRLEFNPPLRKTNEFELTIGITVTIERA